MPTQSAARGSNFTCPPGNLVSEPLRVTLDAEAGHSPGLKLTAGVLPAIPWPADTKYVKRVSFKSGLISKFWATDMRFGAIVVLPKGYDEHPNVTIPWFSIKVTRWKASLSALSSSCRPHARATRNPRAQKHYAQIKALHDAWLSDSTAPGDLGFAADPTPYYDDSYLANSATRPWEDALMQEMLPYWRANSDHPAAYAASCSAALRAGGFRRLCKFTGRRTSRRLGIYVRPGRLSRVRHVDLYSDSEAFRCPDTNGKARNVSSRARQGPAARQLADFSRPSAVLGSHGRSGEFLICGARCMSGWQRWLSANWSGTIQRKIDRGVVEYWRSHGFDLREYAERNWTALAPVWPVSCISHRRYGQFLFELAMYRMQDFLEVPSAFRQYQVGDP